MRFRSPFLFRFTLVSFVVTAVIAVGLGWMLSRQMINDALDDAAKEAADTATTILTPTVTAADFAPPTPASVAAWQQRAGRIIGGMDIVRVKVWNTRGQVVFSDDAEIIGKIYPLEEEEELGEALEGHVARELSELAKSENAAERRYGRLLEVYVPVIPAGTAQIAGVYEIYRSFTPLQARIGRIQRFIWGGSAAAFALLYASLFALASGASRRLSQLASFPELNPNPMVETHADGTITYMNPPARMLFPDLRTAGAQHPLLTGIASLASQLHRDGKRSTVREVKVGDAFYQQVISYIPEGGLIRHYILDVSERKQAEEEVVHQLQTLTSLYAGAQKLSQSLDSQQLAAEITRTFVEAFGARVAWLGRAEPDGRIQLLNHFPEHVEYPRRIRVRWDDSPAGQGSAGRAIRSGFPVVTPDIAADPGFEAFRDAALAANLRSAGAFPLISRGEPFGMLAVYSNEGDYFTPKRVEFFQAYANLAAAALENARLFENTGARLRQLQALRTIDMAITASVDIQVTLNVLLDHAINGLRVDAADVLLLNRHSNALAYAIGRGFRTSAARHVRLRLGEGLAGRAALERRIISHPNLPEAGQQFVRPSMVAAEEFITYYAAPLVAKGQVVGVLEIFHRSPLDPDSDWLDFLSSLAGQAAIAIDSAALFNDLQQANADLTLAYDTTLEGWVRTLDLRDEETEGHTQRVTDLTVRLAASMGIREDQLAHIRRGALLHDIGKIAIPDAILLKPGPLTDEEWEVMRRHPVYAYELLSPIAYLRPALDIPYAHHEKWDGTGYPRGLKEEQIPLAARIFAIVDVWDALRSDRPYRKAWSEARAREYLRSQRGKHFDPQVVDALFELMQDAPGPGQ